MIKFFRKIRKQLLSEKRFGNYLLYAIGEIILVVIGILIALAINNSNENRIKQEKEQVYLVGLKKEFETSKRKLEVLIDVNRRNYEGVQKILDHMVQGSTQPTEEEFSSLLYDSFVFDISFHPNISLLNEMVNSGSLKDISNNQLRILLTNWISDLEDIAKQESDLSQQRDEALDIFRGNANSLRTVIDLAGISEKMDMPKREDNISNLELLDSIEFENHMLIFILTSIATEVEHYNPLMGSLDAILELLDSEIKE